MSDRLAVAFGQLLPFTAFHRGVDEAKQKELRHKALWGLIDEELQYQASQTMRITVSDLEVESGLQRAKQRYKSPQAFEAARKSSGATLAEIRREIRRSLAVQKAFASAVGSKCEVSDAETAAFYASNPDRFVIPERLRLYSITIRVDPAASKAEWANGRHRAEEVRQQIVAGASFEDMARRHSNDPAGPKGGDMGLVHRGSLIDEFERAAKDMTPGELSEVVQTIHGYHILRLAAIHPPARKTLDETKAQLRKDLTEQRCTASGDAWKRQLRAAARIIVLDEASQKRVRAREP